MSSTQAMSMSYEQMVDGCRRHDAKAQRALYDELAPMAMGVCMRYCTDRDEAQDLLQDGMVRVFEKIGSLKEPQKLRSWVYSIMVNCCVQHLRQARHERVSDELDTVADEADLTPFTMRDIVEALHQIDNRQRLVFNLCAIEGRSSDDVASEMGISAGNVRIMLYRARATMRAYLEKKLK